MVTTCRVSSEGKGFGSVKASYVHINSARLGWLLEAVQKGTPILKTAISGAKEVSTRISFSPQKDRAHMVSQDRPARRALVPLCSTALLLGITGIHNAK